MKGLDEQRCDMYKNNLKKSGIKHPKPLCASFFLCTYRELCVSLHCVPVSVSLGVHAWIPAVLSFSQQFACLEPQTE